MILLVKRRNLHLNDGRTKTFLFGGGAFEWHIYGGGEINTMQDAGQFEFKNLLFYAAWMHKQETIYHEYDSLSTLVYEHLKEEVAIYLYHINGVDKFTQDFHLSYQHVFCASSSFVPLCLLPQAIDYSMRVNFTSWLFCALYDIFSDHVKIVWYMRKACMRHKTQ